MLNIRYGIFETNSSSTHAMIMCNDVDWHALKLGENMIAGWEYQQGQFHNTFVPREEVFQWFKEVFYPKYEKEIKTDWDIDCELSDELIEEILAEYDIAYTLENYGHEEYERFEDEYVTSGGEVVHAFGYYGNDY